jgi:hypothetical protein
MNLIKANNRFERDAGIDHFLFRPCAVARAPHAKRYAHK